MSSARNLGWRLSLVTAGMLCLASSTKQPTAKDPAPTTPASDKVIEVESVLDKLEKHIDAEEMAPVAPVTPVAPATSAKSDDKVTRLSFPPARITGHVKETERLRELTKAIDSLASEIDALAADVGKSKESLMRDAAADNFIDIEARVPETESAAVKSLSVRIDGFEIYTLSDSAGLWLPTRAIPLYAGPMRPGSHRVDVDIRMVTRHKNPLPMNASVYRTATRVFELSVAPDLERKRWSILVTPPDADKADSAPEITLEEGPSVAKPDKPAPTGKEHK